MDDDDAVKQSEITPGEYTRPIEVDTVKQPFVFEGESFWDAEEDEHRPSNDFDYWGMVVEDTATYYFEYATGRTQWEPPAHLVYHDTYQVLLWDATEQWFYVYDYKHGTSRWLDHFGDLREDGAAPGEDCQSQGTAPSPRAL
ncbi:hypothetical protein ACHHYP_12348 [Achlya hypogyna]|uniref:WW domain-containing protein n=1 Tax=Achlya hypogyna TaxID=1202772 RepID=A0A1V9ZGY6_ACHHY|nr:hypothetical protein ACHHYP_12348 [Achlya hypogyna]